jgi:hypothetical protein
LAETIEKDVIRPMMRKMTWCWMRPKVMKIMCHRTRLGMMEMIWRCRARWECKSLAQ